MAVWTKFSCVEKTLIEVWKYEGFYSWHLLEEMQFCTLHFHHCSLLTHTHWNLLTCSINGKYALLDPSKHSPECFLVCNFVSSMLSFIPCIRKRIQCYGMGQFLFIYVHLSSLEWPHPFAKIWIYELKLILYAMLFLVLYVTFVHTVKMKRWEWKSAIA